MTIKKRRHLHEPRYDFLGKGLAQVGDEQGSLTAWPPMDGLKSTASELVDLPT